MPLSFYYNSVSEESLNRLHYEPILYSNYPRRRLSASDLQEELCAQGHTLHIDPRYRDTRPIARSSSSLYLFDNISPSRSRTDLCNPTIFIEEYNDNAQPEPPADTQSNDSASLDMRRASIISEVHQPLNEDGIASVADSEEEIPFIDEDFPMNEDVYVPSSASNRTGRGIMVKNTASERRASSCRKTVSFDLVENEPSKRNSISLDRENANFNRKSSTFDTFSSFYNNIRGSNDSLGNYSNYTTCLPKVQIFDESDVELEVECPSPCHRQLNPERSTSPLMNNKQRRRSMSAVPVPLRKFSSSSEVSIIQKKMKPPMKYSSYNSFNTPSIVIEPAPTVKQFGEGKVRELAEFFESQLQLQSQNPESKSFPKCFQFKNYVSNSTPNLCDENMLNEEEKCKVLKQLKEWGVHGTNGKDYLLDFSLKSPKSSQCYCCSNQKHLFRSESCLTCCCHLQLQHHGCYQNPHHPIEMRCRNRKSMDNYECCPKTRSITLQQLDFA